MGMVNFGFCALTNKNMYMGGHARHFNILTVLGVALSLSEPQSGHAQKCRLQLGFAPLIPSVQAHFQHGVENFQCILALLAHVRAMWHG